MTNTRQIFLEKILWLCTTYQGSVTSWLRTTRHNQNVRGHPQSQHLSGTAVDVILDDPAKTTNFIFEAQALNLVALDEKNHIHVQLPRKKP